MNLCKLPQHEQKAIELDKALWYTAHQKITTCNRNDVLNWLETLAPDDKKDMRKRLNAIHARLRKQHQSTTHQMQKDLKAA